MKFLTVLTGALAVCPMVTCLAQTNTTSGQSINLFASQAGNPTAVATTLGTSRRGLNGALFPIIGPREFTDQRRGLGIGQEGFGTTIGQQGTTPIEPVVVPDFGLTRTEPSPLRIGQQGFATAFGGQITPFVSSGLVPGFIGRSGVGLIGPQTPGSTAVGSQIVALAINAQNSTLTIGPQGVANVGSGKLNPVTTGQTRIFTVPGIPHTAFAGRTSTTMVRGH